eukprot:TRINITY_DN9926_c0_g1_i2.p1 TRINITY_DN9926_c0_g1~~TRINITY_DN9926_c0_g1_i2.p1  ORF type:complete len:101 (-),score=14.93 TRINITY_DN9926_c0_g1_i2:132-434(-)
MQALAHVLFLILSHKELLSFLALVLALACTLALDRVHEGRHIGRHCPAVIADTAPLLAHLRVLLLLLNLVHAPLLPLAQQLVHGARLFERALVKKRSNRR